jgi:hypothetical protein
MSEREVVEVPAITLLPRLLVLGLIALLWWGCGTTCPRKMDTRCNGSVVELCGSNLKWQRVMNCADVKAARPGASPKWKCADTGQGCACVPAE